MDIKIEGKGKTSLKVGDIIHFEQSGNAYLVIRMPNGGVNAVTLKGHSFLLSTTQDDEDKFILKLAGTGKYAIYTSTEWELQLIQRGR